MSNDIDLDEKTVIKNYNIVYEGKPKSTTIKGNKYYISKGKIKEEVGRQFDAGFSTIKQAIKFYKTNSPRTRRRKENSKKDFIQSCRRG